MEYVPESDDSKRKFPVSEVSIKSPVCEVSTKVPVPKFRFFVKINSVPPGLPTTNIFPLMASGVSDMPVNVVTESVIASATSFTVALLLTPPLETSISPPVGTGEIVES